MVIVEPWDQLSELEHVAQHDELTGLLNRRGIRRQAEITFTAMPALLAIIDIDGLKPVNDRYGHHVGDAVISLVAGTLAEVAPLGSLVGRWSGDEFVLITVRTPGCASPSELAARVRSAFDGAAGGTVDALHGVPVRPAVSVGATEFAPDQDLDAAIAAADEQMYADKHSAKSRRPSVRPRWIHRLRSWRLIATSSTERP